MKLKINFDKQTKIPNEILSKFLEDDSLSEFEKYLIKHDMNLQG